MMKNKILILFAHPSQQRSEANVPLFGASQGLEGVTTVDLYHEYPKYHIDINREQQRLLSHDVIVFMFPLYWYSTPAILKEWQDLVLEHGFAYGHKGTALQGKPFLCAITTGGPESAFRAEGYNQIRLRELLRPLEQTANLCGMQFIAPYALFGARTAVEEGRLNDHLSNWKRVLAALHENRLDLDKAQQLDMLNDDLDGLLGIIP
jgi:putative NADPH-quinone reductase